MSRIIFSLIILVFLPCSRLFPETTTADVNHKDWSHLNIKNGDIIFQTFEGTQTKAIQYATKSEYSHVGMVYITDDTYILEAVGPVRITLLNEWIHLNEKDSFVVKRLKNADKILTKTAWKRIQALGKKYLGRRYDLHFGWGDDKLYCSELVWKLYKYGAGIEIGKLRKMKDFDLEHPVVKKLLAERYGDSVPKEETVISPADMYDSEELITIYDN